LLIVSEWSPPVGLTAGWVVSTGTREYGYRSLKSVTGAWPLRTGEMSQTENGQLGEPPHVPHVELALPAKINARCGFAGSSQR
jgi:hypothetical protein